LLSALYCVAAGVYLLVDWVDPVVNANTEYTPHGRGSGFIVLMIRFWPYVLIGLGGVVAYNAALYIWYDRKHT